MWRTKSPQNQKETIMLPVADRKLFRTNAVYIPTKDGKEGRDFDRSDCTLLFVDGVYSHAEVYTQEEWTKGGSPSYIQRRGDFYMPNGSEIPVGRAQLLPDTCIVKASEREYWCEDVQAMTKRIFGVYALDRRQHHHLCEFCASYELWFIESQYEETDEVAGDDDKRNELNEMILEGDRDTEPVSYAHRKEIDPLFLRGRRCRPGRLPTADHGGGYRLRNLNVVTWDGVMEEIWEMRCNSDI
jgi:hypothetical protein